MPDEESISLELLSPSYKEESHKEYVSLVEDALSKGALNIALSGVYGTGKSSILEEVAKENEPNVARISFAPLADNISEIRQDTTTDSFAESPTNRIQKEIIKQLLYSIKPDKLPHSRLSRIHWTGKKQLILRSAGIGFLCLLLLWLTGGYDVIYDRHFSPDSKAAGQISNFQWFAKYLGLPLLIFLIFGFITYMLLKHYSGRLTLEKVAAGSMTVTLSSKDGASTYFDKYLDEIVYYFLETDKRIVILEDLDRFETPQIFDSLRELNNVLNTSLKAQIEESSKAGRIFSRKQQAINEKVPYKGKSTKIQFIYAIKDSVFQNQLASKDSENPSQSNRLPFARTKFFDVIIPVVPFISHENARHLAATYFNDDNELREVLDVAAPFIPDMRILLNISNEYKVYKRELNKNDQLKKSGLDCAHLLGFLIYKNTYLEDACKLSDGNSNLDFIYNAKQTIIDQELKNTRSEIDTIEIELDALRGADGQAYAEALGESLKGLFAKTMGSSIGYISVLGKTTQLTEISDKQLWQDIANMPEEKYIVLHSSNGTFKLTRLQLSSLLDKQLDIKLYSETEIDRRKKHQQELQRKLQYLERASFVDLLDTSEQYSAHLDDSGNLDTNKENKELSLRDFVQGRFDDHKLVLALLESGYLNEDYIQYSIIFGEAIPAKARNFIYHHVNQHKPSFDFSFDGEEARIVVEEVAKGGDRPFRDPAMLNCDLLDYLAESTGPRNVSLFNTQITMLAKLDNDSSDFLGVYMKQGKQRDKVIKCLAPECPGIFSFLFKRNLSDKEMEHDTNIVLSNLNSKTDYRLSDENRERAKKIFEAIANSPKKLNDGNVNAFNNESISPDPLVKLCQELGVHVSSIKNLSAVLQLGFIKANLYEFTRANLTNSGRLQSLDEMKGTKK